MSYFPCDIPFMSDEELKENGIKIPKDVTETNVGNTDYIRREDAITAACKGFCHPGVRCPDEPCMEHTKYLRELPSADVVQVVSCEDAVSRQAAIGCLRSGQICGEYCRKAINELPTITPKPRTGKWIDTDNYYRRWKCSECGSHTKEAQPPFCSYCGAKMDAKGEE